MVRKIDFILKGYYEDTYSEDERLTKDKMHYLEFITTTKYVDKYIKENDRILEVGAGTGAYSLYYASRGYKVDAIELVPSNVKVIKSKIKDDMELQAFEGNAIDLSRYADNTFDVTLVLGPLYHLFEKEEIDKCIKEAIRVTKPNGVIHFAFILFDLSLITWGFQAKNIYDNYGDDKQVSLDFTPKNTESLIFHLRYFADIKKLMEQYPIDIMHYVATDGMGRAIKDTINDMSEEEYKMYVDYHMSICEREDLIGYSGHILAITRKREK